jgi:hypothetical protein
MTRKKGKSPAGAVDMAARSVIRASKKKNAIATKTRKPRKPKSLREAPKIDQGWWLDQLDRVRKSQAQVAREIEMDYGAFNRTLKGKRMVTPLETEQLAAALNVPHDEVLRAFGINPDVGSAGGKNVPVKGIIDASGVVAFGGKVEEPRLVVPPQKVPVETVCLRYDTDGTPAAFRHGWVAFYTPRSGIHPDALGRYCFVELREGGKYVRVLKRSHKVGTYCLVDPSGNGSSDLDGVRVMTAVPISWIRC